MATMFRIASVPEHRAEEAGAVLARSFLETPWVRHVFPDPVRRERALPPFFAAAVADALAHGRVDGAFEDERLLGVAVWLPPGAYPWGALRKLQAMPRMLRVLLAAPHSFPALTRLGACVEQAFPTGGAPSYLEVVGVDDDARGSGVGTQLLEPALRRADAEQSHCYLETDTERNVGWYRRLGFRVERSGLQLAGPEGPAYWTMTRPPQAVDRA